MVVPFPVLTASTRAPDPPIKHRLISLCFLSFFLLLAGRSMSHFCNCTTVAHAFLRARDAAYRSLLMQYMHTSIHVLRGCVLPLLYDLVAASRKVPLSPLSTPPTPPDPSRLVDEKAKTFRSNEKRLDHRLAVIRNRARQKPQHSAKAVDDERTKHHPLPPHTASKQADRPSTTDRRLSALLSGPICR